MKKQILILSTMMAILLSFGFLSGCDDSGNGVSFPDDYSVCDGVCIDTNHDALNCGECGNTCDGSDVCVAGTCSSACSNGTTMCNDTCVDTNNDDANCGSCDNICDNGQICVEGSCTIICGGGTTKCSDSCVDTNVDPNHCGDCDTVCDTGQVCDSGSCSLSCSGGTSECNGGCADFTSDHDNCGSCGNADNIDIPNYSEYWEVSYNISLAPGETKSILAFHMYGDQIEYNPNTYLMNLTDDILNSVDNEGIGSRYLTGLSMMEYNTISNWP